MESAVPVCRFFFRNNRPQENENPLNCVEVEIWHYRWWKTGRQERVKYYYWKGEEVVIAQKIVKRLLEIDAMCTKRSEYVNARVEKLLPLQSSCYEKHFRVMEFQSLGSVQTSIAGSKREISLHFFRSSNHSIRLLEVYCKEIVKSNIKND